MVVESGELNILDYELALSDSDERLVLTREFYVWNCHILKLNVWEITAYKRPKAFNEIMLLCMR